MQQRPITLYVKPTNYCNVGCSHCYLPETVRADKGRMSFETLTAVARMARDMAQRQRMPGVHVLWHGGEPLTVPLDWYWRAGEILDRELPGHTESIQTSLIPYRHDHAPLVRERFGGHIGSSVDFSQRTVKGSVEGYHALWMQKVDMARADGFLVVPGLVPTVAEVTRAKEILAWFVARGFRFFNIDRYNHFGSGEDAARPSNAAHSRFLIALFDAAMDELERTGAAPVINVVGAALRGVMFGQPGDRWGTTCQSDFVVVEPDGSTNACPDKARFETAYSNVHDGFAAFAAAPLRRHWIRTQALGHKRPHCETCSFNHFCKSGCPITPNGYLDGEDECSGYHSYLVHVRRFVEGAGRAMAEAYLHQSAGAPATAYGDAA